MMAQSTMTKETPPNFKNVGVTPSHLPLISSLASLEQFFAKSGTPVVEGSPGLDRMGATSKKPQLEFLAPPEVGPYR